MKFDVVEILADGGVEVLAYGLPAAEAEEKAGEYRRAGKEVNVVSVAWRAHP